MISKKKLAFLCRQLAQLTDAGVTLRRSFQTMGRTVRGKPRRVMLAVADKIGEGASLEEALQQYKDYFPPLFLRLVGVGERTGTMDRVFRHLADYYERQHAMIRRVWASLIWPAFELFIAICVIGLVKYLATDFLYPGGDISGAEAATRHFLTWGGALAGVAGLYVFVTRVLRGQRIVDEILLHIPVIRRAVRALAVARFTWTLQLAQMAGIPITEALQRAAEATNNAAFAARRYLMADIIREGGTLRQAMEASGLFPPTTLAMVEVAETAGKVEDSMRRVAENSFEDAALAMQNLSKAFAWLVWLVVAGIIIYYIFTLWGRVLSMYSI